MEDEMKIQGNVEGAGTMTNQELADMVHAADAARAATLGITLRELYARRQRARRATKRGHKRARRCSDVYIGDDEMGAGAHYAGE